MNKSKYAYIWISLVALIFGILTIPTIVKRIKSSTVVKEERSKTIEPKLPYVILNNEKRQVPDFSFINQDSLLITNKDYLDKVYVVEFFFASCPSICPIMNKNLVQIQDQFEDIEDFGVASFTIDPENDTPRVLKEYAELYGIKDLDWHLLTGDREAVYRLSNEGFNIFAAANEEVEGGFEHSGNVALIDREGFIRSRKDNFGNLIIYYDILEDEGVAMLREDIKKLLEE